MQKAGVFGFPTETVYGIGALIDDTKALKRIFKIKGRSSKKPLQILISNGKQLKKLSRGLSQQAKELIAKHWPGPLTIIVKKSRYVPNIVTAARGKVGLRMPAHPLILKLIEKVGPIVATSANRSGQKPALTAKEVKKYVPEVDYIIDGGKARLGLASTVVDLTGKTPRILRQGSIKL